MYKFQNQRSSIHCHCQSCLAPRSLHHSTTLHLPPRPNQTRRRLAPLNNSESSSMASTSSALKVLRRVAIVLSVFVIILCLFRGEWQNTAKLSSRVNLDNARVTGLCVPPDYASAGRTRGPRIRSPPLG